MKQIDRDFFRAMAHERADRMAAATSPEHAIDMIDAALREFANAEIGDPEMASHNLGVDALAQIAAVAERAAVDLILPQCSTRNKVEALTKSGPRGATGPTKGKA